MNKKTLAGLALGAAMIILLGGMITGSTWQDDGGMKDIPFGPSDDVPFEDTLNFAIFEEYGAILMIVTLMLFGAIIGAACIAKEEEDNDSN